MQALNDAMLNISQGYNYYDNWYLNQTEYHDIAEYYQGNFSQHLRDAIARDPEKVWAINITLRWQSLPLVFSFFAIVMFASCSSMD